MKLVLVRKDLLQQGASKQIFFIGNVIGNQSVMLTFTRIIKTSYWHRNNITSSVQLQIEMKRREIVTVDMKKVTKTNKPTEFQSRKDSSIKMSVNVCFTFT